MSVHAKRSVLNASFYLRFYLSLFNKVGKISLFFQSVDVRSQEYEIKGKSEVR